jgi:hypothetical protein
MTYYFFENVHLADKGRYHLVRLWGMVTGSVERDDGTQRKIRKVMELNQSLIRLDCVGEERDIFCCKSQIALGFAGSYDQCFWVQIGLLRRYQPLKGNNQTFLWSEQKRQINIGIPDF